MVLKLINTVTTVGLLLVLASCSTNRTPIETPNQAVPVPTNSKPTTKEKEPSRKIEDLKIKEGTKTSSEIQNKKKSDDNSSKNNPSTSTSEPEAQFYDDPSGLPPKGVDRAEDYKGELNNNRPPDYIQVEKPPKQFNPAPTPKQSKQTKVNTAPVDEVPEGTAVIVKPQLEEVPEGTAVIVQPKKK